MTALRKIPFEVLARMCNVMLFCGNLPSRMLESRTVLRPKQANAVDPAHFHPVAVSSLLVRTIHDEALARRFKIVPLNRRQRTF